MCYFEFWRASLRGRPHSVGQAIPSPPKYLALQDHSMEGPPLAGRTSFKPSRKLHP